MDVRGPYTSPTLPAPKRRGGDELFSVYVDFVSTKSEHERLLEAKLPGLRQTLPTRGLSVPRLNTVMERHTENRCGSLRPKSGLFDGTMFLVRFDLFVRVLSKRCSDTSATTYLSDNCQNYRQNLIFTVTHKYFF